MKLVIATATHNCLKYTRMCLNSIKCSYPYEILVVDNGSTDGTPEWLKERSILTISHKENRGTPYAHNDALEYTFEKGNGDSLLLLGNDTILHSKCIDHLIQTSLETNFDILSGHQITEFSKFSRQKIEVNIEKVERALSLEWEKYNKLVYRSGGLNYACSLKNRYSFEKVGYFDVNFYPGYSEDSDYSRRCRLLGVKHGTVESAIFNHFQSRTLYEGGIEVAELRRAQKERRRQYWTRKWGGHPGAEIYKLPFGSQDLKISSREKELEILRSCGMK